MKALKKKTPLGPRVQGMQIFPRWPCLRYILPLFWRHSSTAITPSVLLSFSSFFLQGIWILIHHPSPLLACHLLFLKSESLFESISTFLRRRHSLCRSQNSRAHTCTKKNPPLMQMRFRGRSGEVSDQSSLIPGIWNGLFPPNLDTFQLHKTNLQFNPFLSQICVWVIPPPLPKRKSTTSLKPSHQLFLGTLQYIKIY